LFLIYFGAKREGIGMKESRDATQFQGNSREFTKGVEETVMRGVIAAGFWGSEWERASSRQL
jgi:hypothetical protein